MQVRDWKWICVVKGAKVLGGRDESAGRIVSFGGTREHEEPLRQGLFSGGTLGCGSNLGGTHSSEREMRSSGRPREGVMCVGNGEP